MASTTLNIKLRLIIQLLFCNIIHSAFAAQIPGTTPAIPGILPNMFPLATGQVIFSRGMRTSKHLLLTYFSLIFLLYLMLCLLTLILLPSLNPLPVAVWSSSCYASPSYDSAGWQDYAICSLQLILILYPFMPQCLLLG